MNIRIFRKKTEYDLVKRTKADNYSFLSNNCCKKGQTVIVGDSITEIFNMDLFAPYTGKTGLHVYNRGISGDTSDRLLERFYDNVLTIEPKNMVLLIGTNDLTINASAEYVADNIEKMLDLSLESCPDMSIFLQSVYPVEYKNKKKNLEIIKLNEILSRLCNRKNITFIDLSERLTDDKGGLNMAYTYDGLHPNARGFKVIADEILRYLYSEKQYEQV